MSVMSSKTKTRRGYVSRPAVCPVDGTIWDVLISYTRLDAVAKRGMLHANECAFIVPAILRGPTAIFEGLRKDEDKDKEGNGWLCYSAIPDRSYLKDGSQAPPWQDEVFLVFVNEDRVAYNWRWEQCDRQDETLPNDYEERFEKRVL